MVERAGDEHHTRSVTNDLAGRVTGSVVQAGTIHQVVLRQPTPPEELPVPRQLPPTVRDFSGRDVQLAELDALLVSSGREQPASTTISALDGTAGVGKTTLAVQWAHRVEHRFADGTLFANLRGYGPSAPLDPNLVLTSFLQDFGIHEERIPAELDAQASLYRSLLAKRRVLVLLDNASTAEQVRPLLPGSPGCLVLVTSRASLTGLMIAEAASQVTLDLFTPDEARELVGAILGPARVAAEPEAVADLIEVCARLPLALRIAATRIATRRHTSVAEVVEDITGDQHGLDTLNRSGDERSAVRTVFDWSYTQLPEEQARLFRQLGLHPGVEFSVHAAAVLADLSPAVAYRRLEALADAHLIEPVGGKRYRFHDLLHTYATERAAVDEKTEDRQRAVISLIHWYAATAQTADKLVFPSHASFAVEIAASGRKPPLADRGQALAWLNTEQANLMSALRSAIRHRAYHAALGLASTARFLRLRDRALWSVRLEAESLGIDAARAIPNNAAEAFLLGFRGDTHADLGQLDEAEADFSHVLVLAEEDGDPVRKRVALVGLGQVHLLQERYAEALDYYHQALPLARSAGGGRPEAVVECNLSRINARLGRYEEALEHAERELVLRRQAADSVGEAYALLDGAAARQGLGEYQAAIELAHEAIAMYRNLAGTETSLARALETAADSFEQIGDVAQTTEHLREAYGILEELGVPHAEAVRARVLELESRTPAHDDE